MLYPQRSAMGVTLLAAIALSAPARAQVLTLDPGQDGVRRDPEHDKELANNEINKEDCLRGEAIDFNVGVTGVIPLEFDFQVWRGTDCANDDRRYEDSSNCVEIKVDEAREDRSINFSIPIQTLIFGTTSDGSGGTGGTSGNGGAGAGGSGAAGAGGLGAAAGTGGTGATAGTSATGGSSGEDGGASPNITSCDGDRSFPTPQQLTLHFIYVNGNGEQPTENYQPASWEARYDLVGPNAPRGVQAGIGENTLVLSWTIEDNRGDINKYYAYCDPPPDAMVEPSNRCDTTLVSGVEPPGEYFCGESDGYSASMQTVALQNNVTYAVAVAGVDNFNNVGLLSEHDCEAPQLVTDFYEAYRQAGGKGGGGFCAVGARPAGGVAAFVALGALALYARRRAARTARKAR